MNERDRAPRQALRLPTTFWRLGGQGTRTSGVVINVSKLGVYIATYEPLPLETPVMIEIEYPARSVRIVGEVVHDESLAEAAEKTIFEAGMGVRFNHPDDPDVVELARLGQPLADGGGRRRHPR